MSTFRGIGPAQAARGERLLVLRAELAAEAALPLQLPLSGDPVERRLHVEPAAEDRSLKL